MPVHIRWMLRHDMPDVLAIEAESFELPWPEEDFMRCLRRRHSIGMVAEYDERVVGFIVYELIRSKIHILNLAVGRDYRRRGVGRQLIEKQTQKLRPGGRCRVSVEVRETNLPAQLFFSACGFRAVNVLRDYYPDANEDAYAMIYRLGANVPAEGVAP